MLATTSPATTLEIRCAGDDDADALAEFYREVWNPTATAEAVIAARRESARLNTVQPDTAPPTIVAFHRGRVAGLVGAVPTRLWDGRTERPAYWVKGLMVRPSYRNGPIGYSVLKTAAQQYPCTAALVVAPAARRLFGAVGYMDVGAIDNWMLPLAPARILARANTALLGNGRPLQRLAAAASRNAIASGLASVAGHALRGARALVRLSAAGLVTRPVDLRAAGGALTALWREARDKLPAATVRDGVQLAGRYGNDRHGRYQCVAAVRRGVLRGVAVMRAVRVSTDDRLKGLRIAALSDILFPPDDTATGVALLGGVEAMARDSHADAVVASASAAPLRAALRRQCYLRVGGGMHLFVRDSDEEPGHWSANVQDWWITRGDSLADESF